MRKIKIAQIGIGHDHADVTFDTLRRLTDIFDVVGYARVPEDDLPYEWSQNNRVKPSMEYDGAREYTVDEILAMSDLDAVAVETYDLYLVKYAQMAADKGLHLHMDKAPGDNAEAFEKLLSTVKAKNLAFSVGYIYRFNPAVREAFEKIQKGEIGKIHAVDAEMNCYYASDKREWLGGFQGGMTQYLGCHLIDLIVRLLGVPKEIIPYNLASGADGVTTKDLGFAIFRYDGAMATARSSMMDVGGYTRRHFIVNGENGSIAVCPLERDVGGYTRRHFVLNGENGSIAVCPLERAEPQGNGCKYALSTTSKRYTMNATWGEGETTEYPTFDRYQDMLRAFAAMARGERGYEVDLETEARVQRCLLAACGIACDYQAEIRF